MERVSKNKMLARTKAVLEPDLICRIVLVVAMEMCLRNSPGIENVSVKYLGYFDWEKWGDTAKPLPAGHNAISYLLPLLLLVSFPKKDPMR